MSLRGFSEVERTAFYNTLEFLDPTKLFVVFDKEADSLSYTKRIKSYENISGRPNDEELTRALILLRLIVSYGYKPESLEIENTFSIGGRRSEGARAVETDICITDEKGDIEILCEVKRIQDFHGTDDPSIRKQLFDPFENIVKYNSAKYLFHLSVDIPLSESHFPLTCVGIDTSIVKTYNEWSKQGRISHLIDLKVAGDKPVVKNVYVKTNGSQPLSSQNIKDLEDNFGIDRIRRIWKVLWDHIWGGTLEDNKKFENFNKVVLAKIYDERKTRLGTPYSFQRKITGGLIQTEEELANDIDLLYRKAFREYLSKDKNIELFSVAGIDFKEFSPNLISKCVELLYGLSFHRNRYKNVDILGEFYEMVIRDAFKQTKGLFLTHPNIVLFILSVLDVDEMVKNHLKYPNEDNRYRLPFVIDPSCGTGTFLVTYMKYVQKFITDNQRQICGGDEDVKDFIERNILNQNSFKWVIDYVYGIDNEPVLATACQINLILHGDGSTNIYNTDALSAFKSFENSEVTGAVNILSSKITVSHAYYSMPSLEKFDLIISNPPFNVKVNKDKIQDHFNIKGKSEAYFLERWYQLLTPGGRIGVVLPESFFSVENDIEGRYFLYKHFNIRAIVSLPSHSFQPHTPTNTSLLFASKKTRTEESTFMKMWARYDMNFSTIRDSILKEFPSSRAKVVFKESDANNPLHISQILQTIEQKFKLNFSPGFVVLPSFDEDFINDDSNYSSLKKIFKDLLDALRDRWILHKVSSESQNTFYNYSVDEIGYKAGKKGSKDKPNELFSAFDAANEKIFNLKYSHSWDRVDDGDTETVLGIIKGNNIWQ